MGFDDVAGCWPDLVARLERTHALTRWARDEPALSGIGSVVRLQELTGRGADPGRADELLGALVRCAAADGGDDEDAVLLLVHLLGDGVRALAARLADLDHKGRILGLLVGELVLQVRCFPWRRRTRAIAANLLLDTRGAVLREFGVRRGVRRTELLVDPLNSHWWEMACVPAVGPGEREDPVQDLLQLLTWAARSGAAEGEDLRLLWELERHRGYGHAARATVAAAWGVNERTVRRRCTRVLAALQSAAPDYAAA